MSALYQMPFVIKNLRTGLGLQRTSCLVQGGDLTLMILREFEARPQFT